MRSVIRAVSAAGLLALLTVTSGCNDEDWRSRECSIAEDQRDSFMARVGGFPIPLVVDRSFEKDEKEMQALNAAIRQWNARGRELINDNFFNVVQGDDYSSTSPDLSNCGENIPAAGNSLILQRENREYRWEQIKRSKTSAGTTSVGVTFRCTIGDQAHRQVTIVNTQRINGQQLSSVVLHELGHALGLDHSCDSGAGSENYRACYGLAMNHPYRLAIMYPTLQMPHHGATWIEIKDNIRSNDLDRIKCMYGPK